MRRMLLSGKTMVALAALLVLFAAAGVAEGERLDAGGQWTFVLEDGGAVLAECSEKEPKGDLVIPDEADGHAVTGIGKYAFALVATNGSYAERGAKENDLPYIFADEDGANAEPPHREKVTLINDQTVNIRIGPGTHFQQIGEVYPGASFYFTGVVEGDFYQIVYPDIRNNPQYNAAADSSPGALCTVAYVMRSLADVSPVNPEDSIFSSLVGNLKVKPRAPIFLDAALSKEARGSFGDETCVPFAGITPSGAYAVLFERANSKGEQVLWIGFISPNDVDAESRLFADEAAIEDEEDRIPAVRTDASGQWRYRPMGSGATVAGYDEYPTGDLAIPSELDGLPVTAIGDEAFLFCESLKSVVIPEGVTSIGREAFGDCISLTHVNIPNSVTRIGPKAFEACRSLTSVDIPEGVTTIEEGAFQGCGFTSVMIPSSVTSIGNNPLIGCPLQSIGVSPGNPAYEQIGGVLFDRRQKMLVTYPDAKKGAYEIPEGALRIGDYAFRACDGLTGITIPDSVTDIGYLAFSVCENLTSVAIPGSVSSIGKSAFLGCNNLTSVIIQDGAKSIGDRAFQGCFSLTSVIIPDSVTTIGDNVFDSQFLKRPVNLILTVAEGSVAERYAKDNGIPHVLAVK